MLRARRAALFGRGRRIAYDTYHDQLTGSAGKAGLGGMTEHGLRHLYASTLLGADVPITDVSAWLGGHRDINVTYATYFHLLPDMDARAAGAGIAGSLGDAAGLQPRLKVPDP